MVLAGATVNGQTITTQTFGSGANQFSIDFVEIGNTNNQPDSNGSPNMAGSVGYIFNLGKFEISRQILEKANAETGLGISLADLSNFGGNNPDRPASGVSWFTAARFVNYLNTTQGFSPAYNFTGSYAGPRNPAGFSLWAEGQNGFNPNNQYRNSQAKFFLPSTDEWYKGAYGVSSGLWYAYPSSGQPPRPVFSGTEVGTAVYGQTTETGPADVNQAGDVSGWGAMGMAGNVWEWTESAFDGENNSPQEKREYRGGAWNFLGESYISNAGRLASDPDGSQIVLGFRVAMIPEPSSLSLLLAGGAVLMAGRRRK